MKHNQVLEKFNFDLLTPPPGWEEGGNIFATMLLHAWAIPFNLICNVTIFWKFSWILTFWPNPQGEGGLRAKYLLPCCSIRDFCLATWSCSEKVEFWPFDSTLQGRGRGASAVKLFATMLLHTSSALIWYATWPYSEKVGFQSLSHLSTGTC